MKKCPFCQAQNREDARFCDNCGRGLISDSVPEDTAPTQPVHTRPVQPGQPRSTEPTQPVPVQVGTGQRLPDASDPYIQYPLPDATQPYPMQGYGQLYEQPVYSPPAPAALPTEDHRSVWPLLIAGLGLILVVICGLAFFTLTGATANRAAGLRAQVSTQIGKVFGGSGSPALVDTSTAVPQVTATQTPDPTQAAVIDKLLSPECKGSLDQLSQVSDQVKNDPLKVLDDTWRKGLDQATADMKTNCGSLNSASPIPGEIGQVQKSMKQANSEFDQANQLWKQAIDQRDPTKAVSAAQHVGEATKYLGQAISQLQKLTR